MKVQDVFKEEYVCVKCGWKRPEGFSSTSCGRCGGTLKSKLVKKKEL